MTEIRADIPAEYKWDLTPIYPDTDAFEADFTRARGLIASVPGYEKTMSESPEALYALMEEMTSLDRLISKLYEYAALHSDVDKSDNQYLALTERVRDLANDAGAASYFVSPALIRLDSEKLEEWFRAYPALEAYRRNIETEQRYRPYTLSDECEKLLADLQNSFGSHSEIRSIFANADLRFGAVTGEEGKKIRLTDANYVPMMMSSDRRVRRAAFRKLYETYRQFGNTFAAMLSGYVRERVTVAKLRGFESSLQASVFRDEVTPEIYNNLIDTVEKNLSVLFRYYDVKREALGLHKLHLYDIYTPLISSCTEKYSFEEAVTDVLDTVRIFGDEYHDTLAEGIRAHHWVDVFPNRGKRSGAYSSGCYDTPPYILLNFNGTLDSVSTLAHEAGHSMHTFFSCKYRTPQQSSYTIFVAEVASTVNELLFSHKKLRETESDMEKLSILNQIMETYKGTLFRQTMFASFEREMHALCAAGEPLTRERLCECYYALNRRYFEPAVVCDKEIALEWMRIPHFYTNFYVYKYATCISAASSIVHRIETEGEAYIGSYLEFLKCGGSRSPIDSLKVAGIDLTRPEVIEDAIADFAETVEQFRTLYQKVYGSRQ